MHSVIPKPVFAVPAEGQFALTPASVITVDPTAPELSAIAEFLAARLRPATGYPLPVLRLVESPVANCIALALDPNDAPLGDEGYDLRVAANGVTLRAFQPAGLFHGVQTLRQLLPATVERPSLQPGPWALAAGHVRDGPRFAWRGVMLDVARHFFTVDEVKRAIDLAATYKLNRFHLHLTDDQGWRIEIKSWPKLTAVGAQTQVGGGAGGYYTQADYADIVAYAAARYVTVVPEIDLPGHTNAALVDYPALNGGPKQPAPYTGVEVGFSTLDIHNGLTYEFVDDVIGELAALTPGEYIHIGGDEAHSTAHADYVRFIERVEGIVQSHGKRMVGWEEIGQCRLAPTTLAQHWANSHGLAAARQGVRLILSPATKVYLDMKYDADTPIGYTWAGHVSVRDSYEWDPAAHLTGVTEADVLGVEAALWTETVGTLAGIEMMLFPRLLGVAEIGWTPAAARSWDDYRPRLAAHGPRLEAMGVNFYRAPEVGWAITEA